MTKHQLISNLFEIYRAGKEIEIRMTNGTAKRGIVTTVAADYIELDETTTCGDIVIIYYSEIEEIIILEEGKKND